MNQNARTIEMIKQLLGHQAFENIVLTARLEEAAKQISEMQPEAKKVEAGQGDI